MLSVVTTWVTTAISPSDLFSISRFSSFFTAEESISQDISLKKGSNTFIYFYQDLGQNSTNPSASVIIPQNMIVCTSSPQIDIDYHSGIFN
jgi:hypothetical protein